MTVNFEYVFAVPGDNSIIDIARPDGRSQYGGNTLEEIQQRHPGAELIPWEQFQAQQVTRQNTPIAWLPSTAEQYDEMLCILPPIAWDSTYGFLVGEACDHSYETGKPRFQAYRQRGRVFEKASRPMTVAEFTTCKAQRRL